MSGLSGAPALATASLAERGLGQVLVASEATAALAGLVDALEESGYSATVVPGGEAALRRAAKLQPDIVLVESTLPDMDGFELLRRLKADLATAGLPVLFITARTDVAHLMAALDAGAADCVTKPVTAREVLVRIALQLQGARERRQVRHALDAFGHATVAVRPSDGRCMWETPLARELLQAYFDCSAPATPQELLHWLRRHAAEAAKPPEARQEPTELTLRRGARRLSFRLHPHTSEDDWLVVLREESDAGGIEEISRTFRLTARESEVLYWVVKGKINRDIGDILGTRPMTVKKHLERVFAKLGVETRTAAAAMVLGRIRQLGTGLEA